MNQFFAQMIGFLAMIFCIGSYQVKKSRRMILCQTIGNLIYVIHYWMLGAYSGCVTLCVCAASQIVCNFQIHKKWVNWKGWRWLFTVLLIVACLIVWRENFQMIPCVCAIISMSSVTLITWTRNTKFIRLNKLICAGPLWLVYAIAVNSWSSIICEVIGMISAAATVFRYNQGAAAKKEFMN
ncbi:MAG: YgjV family protein [Dysosmobacter sp.]|nr:YgjV family protein [Dysosmobacter sp.]